MGVKQVVSGCFLQSKINISKGVNFKEKFFFSKFGKCQNKDAKKLFDNFIQHLRSKVNLIKLQLLRKFYLFNIGNVS